MTQQQPTMPANGEPIYFFDSVCRLCNSSISFFVSQMIKSGKRIAVFAPLQGETAKHLLTPELRQDLNTLVWLESPYSSQSAHYRSSAVLRAYSSLGGPWKLLRIGLICPPFIRNLLYNFIARNRYNWWGKTPQCRIPTPQEQSYFLP